MSVYWQRQHGMGEWVMHTASDADMEGVKQTNAGELAKTTSHGTAINEHRGCTLQNRQVKVYKQMGECIMLTAIDAERHGHWTTSKDNIIWGNA